MDDLGGKKIGNIFVGSRETEETASQAGKDGSSVKTESRGALVAADTRAPTSVDEATADPVEQLGQRSNSHWKQRSPTAPASISVLQTSQDRFDFLYSNKRHMCPPGQTRPLKSGQAFRRTEGSYEETNLPLRTPLRGVPKPYCEA